MTPANINVISYIMVVVGVVTLLALIGAAIVSRRENEPVAAGRLFVAAILLPTPFFVAGLASASWGSIPALVLLSLVGVTLIVTLVPFGRGTAIADDIPRGRIDERDIMFSRAAMQP